MLPERGYLKPGFYADLTFFDEEKLRNGVPNQEKPFGIEIVFINGRMILNGETLDEQAVKSAGRAIRIL